MLTNKPVTIEDYLMIHTREEYSNYCEAIIFPDGKIMDAIPCHLDALVKASKESKEAINLKMPMAAAPLDWLVDYTECVAIWYNIMVYHEITKEQLKTIHILLDNRIISSNGTCKWTNELHHCEKIKRLEAGDDSIRFDEPVTKIITIDEFLKEIEV